MPSLRAQLVAASAPGSPASIASPLSRPMTSPLAKLGSDQMAKPDSATGRKRQATPQFYQSQFYAKPFDTAYEELAKARNLRKLEVLFYEADADGSGEMSLDEFRKALRYPRIQRAFSVLGVQPHQSEPIFRFLDKRKTGELSITEFMTGLTDLVGTDIDGTGKELDVDTLRPEYKAKVKYHSHYRAKLIPPVWQRPATSPQPGIAKGTTLDLGPVHLLPSVKVQRAFVHSASARSLYAASSKK